MNLRNQIANFSAQYNRLLERLKEVNAINKQWESQYNEIKITAEATIQEKEHERIRLQDEFSRADSKVRFLEQELEMAKEKMVEIEKEVEDSKKIFAIVSPEEDVVIPKKSEIGGRIKTNMNIKIGESVVVHGDIEGQNVLIGPNCIIIGIIITRGGLSINKKTEVAADIAVGGDLILEAECKVRKVIAGGKVTIGEKCRLDRISSTGSVELKTGVVVKEGIEYVGSLIIGEHVSIGGNIKRKQTPGQGPSVGYQPASSPPNEDEKETEEETEEENEDEGEQESEPQPPQRPLRPIKSCNKCGAVLAETDRVCPNCGRPAKRR